VTHHLKVQDLSKIFTLHMLGGRRMRAFYDVSFAVEPGEFLAVVGRSGSGKSSLLRCLYRSYLPTSGRILYDSEEGEIDLATADDRAVLRLRNGEIGYVSQFLYAIPRVPAREVVAEPLIRRGEDVDEALEQSASMLSALGLSPGLQDTLPATMSGGEQQRVNLARALVSRPRLLLLDKPTSALDPETRALAVDAIRELKAAGTTMVGIFHDADTLGALADRVLAMEDGRVRWSGPAEEAVESMAGV
jgi:alpha-D-ribose 1-methylphosphonate 5-triphosphate synthase subunit PhnL